MPYVSHHYVPRWYQHGFLDANAREAKYFYLDLKPERVVSNGHTHVRDALRRLGPVKCFQQDNLYTLTLGAQSPDVIERLFFGPIDDNGRKAVEFYRDYSLRDGAPDAHRAFLRYLDTQKIRTPRGLRYLAAITRLGKSNDLLRAMTYLSHLHGAMWSEAVWEVFSCAHSPTKFIVTDHPVASYNVKVFPGSSEAMEYAGARIERIGTRTIFPLDLNHCLVITNLQYVRNPGIDPLTVRENARLGGDAMFDLRKIQTGRGLPETDVIAINHIMKSQANRFIAAGDREWLYPEKRLDPKRRFWPKLGNKFFLQPDPRKVSFTTGIVVGSKHGGAWGQNEYGHRDMDGERAQRLRNVEWRTFHAWQDEWDQRFGTLSPQERFRHLSG